MEWVVTTGKTLDEAKDAALDELGVDEVDAEFEILEEPRQGLFGRQRGEARIRARVRPTSPRPKTDRRDRRRKAKPAANGDTTSASPEPAVAVAEPAGPADEVEADATVTAARPSTSPARRRRGRTTRTSGVGADASADGASEDEEDGRNAPAARTNGGTAVPEEELTLTEQGHIAEQFVTGLLERFGVSASTEVVPIDDETIEIRIEGPELGLLIGPKGQTLQAVQEMTRTVVQRRSVARTGRILVDVAGYRVKRRQALERFTQQVAEDVRATGVQRVLEPMSAPDRKIVHDTANDLPGVRTISEGEEPRRRVVILPDASASDGDGGTDDES